MRYKSIVPFDPSKLELFVRLCTGDGMPASAIEKLPPSRKTALIANQWHARFISVCSDPWCCNQVALYELNATTVQAGDTVFFTFKLNVDLTETEDDIGPRAGADRRSRDA